MYIYGSSSIDSNNNINPSEKPLGIITLNGATLYKIDSEDEVYPKDIKNCLKLHGIVYFLLIF